MKGKPKRCFILHRSYDSYHPSSLIQSIFLTKDDDDQDNDNDNDNDEDDTIIVSTHDIP